jgi:outer membrane murein-binding lipoprotein Lpp
MPDMPEDLVGRVPLLEMKVDDLSASLDRLSASVDARFDRVDARFDQVDRRFEAVDAAFLEQRQYTEFGYMRLEATMNAGFGSLTAEVRTFASRFDRFERKLDQFIDSSVSERNRGDRPPQ